MRQDSEIKSDVISELEDIVFGEGDVGILDALIVEEVQVDSGVVSVTLVFDDGCPESDWNALVAAVKESCGDLEDVVTVAVKTLTASSLGTAAGRKGNGATTPAPEATNGRQLLSMAALLGGIKETQDDPAVQNLYSGGGCASGTTEKQVAPASRPTVEPPLAAAAGGGVTLPLAEYTALVRAQRELELRPTFDEHRRALDELAALKARASALSAILEQTRHD